MKTPLLDFKRDFAALLAESLEFVSGKSAPRLSGLPDFRRPADELCETVRTT